MKTIILCIILCSGILFSQVTEEWVHRFDNGTGEKIIVDSNGNVYVGGYISNTGTGIDYMVLKYNNAGNLLWSRSFNTFSNYEDRFTDMILNAANELIVCGNTIRINGSDFDIMIVKFSPEGDTIWTRRFNESGFFGERVFKIVMDQYENIYAAGIEANHSGNSTYLLLKLDQSGNLLWENNYPGIGSDIDWLKDAYVDKKGNIILTGRTEITGSGLNFLTAKIDSTGALLWSKQYNGEANDWDDAICVMTDPDDNVIVAGESSAFNLEVDFLVIKYDTSGNVLWTKRYNGPNNRSDGIRSMDIDVSGNIYVTGYSSASISGGADFTTIKYSPGGTQLWLNRYHLGQFDIARKICVDAEGNSYVAGALNGTAPFYSDYGVIKINNEGSLVWAKTYNGPASDADELYDMFVDTDKNIYATGFSMRAPSGSDAATIKYSQPIGIQPISTSIPSEYKLWQNHPNPFNPVTNIKFQIPLDLYVKLTVYNILGSEVAILINEVLKAGQYVARFDASDFSSGIYFYQMNAGGFSETNKMVLTK